MVVFPWVPWVFSRLLVEAAGNPEKPLDADKKKKKCQQVSVPFRQRDRKRQKILDSHCSTPAQCHRKKKKKKEKQLDSCPNFTCKG